MQTIFLALNGVFENPEDRKTPIYELQGFDTFYESRKLIKIDWFLLYFILIKYILFQLIGHLSFWQLIHLHQIQN